MSSDERASGAFAFQHFGKVIHDTMGREGPNLYENHRCCTAFFWYGEFERVFLVLHIRGASTRVSRHLRVFFGLQRFSHGGLCVS